MVRTPKVRFGIIGCGSHASDVDIPNLYYMPDVEVIGICDIDEAKAAAVQQKYGGRYVTADYQKILSDPEIDAVSIVTGPRFHAQLCIEAAQAGKHIFVEKPIAESLEDAVKVVEAVEEAGIMFQFGVCNRLAPMVRMAKRMCPRPAYTYCQCAHTIEHQAVHNLDLALHLFHEAPLKTVYASGGAFYGYDGQHARERGIDSYVATLTFADGTTHCNIQHGAAMNSHLSKYHFQLFGSDRCVYLAKRFKECHLMLGSNGENVISWGFDGPDQTRGLPEVIAEVRGPFGYMGHYDELEELVACIQGEQSKPSMTARDAAHVFAAELAILESIETGAPVDFPAFLQRYGVVPEPRWDDRAANRAKPIL